MKRRAIRIVVALILAAAAAAAAHQAVTRTWAVEAAGQRVAAARIAGSQANVALSELSAAQRSYVAPGQGLDFWAEKVDEQLAAARDAFTSLNAQEAISRLRDFEEMDRRARQYVRAGQRTLAADLVFADGFEIVAAARNELSVALVAYTAPFEAEIPGERGRQAASLGALAACVLIACLLLLRTPASDAAAPAAPIAEPAPLAPARDFAGADDSIGAALDASLEGLNAPSQPMRPAEPVEPAESNALVDLSSAADVCVDLARLLDARDLPAVLSHAADVFGAQGLVVWLADPSGSSLTPALTHGYAPAVVSRMGSLSVEEDNATSTAYRAKTLQVVHGALAAPLLTAGGCTGVLALELKHGRERASDVQSLARIVAAQLASGISAPAADSRKTAEA